MTRTALFRRRRAFSLLEVLVATAIFGIAAAGLLMAVSPTYDALSRLSAAGGDAGDLELVKGVVEASADRQTVLNGGDFSLPSGDAVGWKVDLEATDTEGMYLVRLHATRGDREPLDYEYLHFEPNWRDQGEERPRWLQHTFGTGGGAGGGGGGAPGGPPGRNNNDPGRGQGQQGQQGQGRGQNAGQGQGRQGQGQGQGRGQGQPGQGGQGQGRGQGGVTGGGARGGR